MRSLLTVLSIMVSGTAVSAVDVDCLFGNCLKEGWRLSAWSGGYRGETECIEETCEFSGWIYRDNRNYHTRVDCQGEGCFVTGAIETDLNTGEVLMESVCANDDCLKYGWSNYLPNDQVLTAYCLQRNCAEVGWEIFSPKGMISRAVCKLNDCFGVGWTIYNFRR
jgi:hypothetical protein